MVWVVDTCVLIDILEDDPEFGASSADLLERFVDDGLTLCPVSYAELAPAFHGDRALQEEFLLGLGAFLPAEWSWGDTVEAHAAWDRFVRLKRREGVPRRPLADILIGAYAAGRSGLVTRNPDDFADVFPDLDLAIP